MFVYVIQYNHWFYFILGVLFYLSSAHGLLYYCVIVTSEFILIYIFNIISISTVICLCNLYYLLLGCNPYWEACCIHLLIYYTIVAILLKLNSK